MVRTGCTAKVLLHCFATSTHAALLVVKECCKVLLTEVPGVIAIKTHKSDARMLKPVCLASWIVAARQPNMPVLEGHTFHRNEADGALTAHGLRTCHCRREAVWTEFSNKHKTRCSRHICAVFKTHQESKENSLRAPLPTFPVAGS